MISVRRISRGIACRTPVPRRQAVVLWMHVLRTCGAGGRCSLSIVVAAGRPQVPHVPLYPVTVACLVGRLWVRAEGVPKRPLFGCYVLSAGCGPAQRGCRRGPSSAVTCRYMPVSLLSGAPRSVEAPLTPLFAHMSGSRAPAEAPSTPPLFGAPPRVFSRCAITQSQSITAAL